MYLKTAELLDLILNERPERRHDNGDSHTHESRELVAETLSPTSRHENETVVIEKRSVYCFELLGPKPLHPKHLKVCVCRWVGGCDRGRERLSE